MMMVLKEPNSRNWFTINVKRIKPFNAATLTTLGEEDLHANHLLEQFQARVEMERRSVFIVISENT